MRSGGGGGAAIWRAACFSSAVHHTTTAQTPRLRNLALTHNSGVQFIRSCCTIVPQDPTRHTLVSKTGNRLLSSISIEANQKWEFSSAFRNSSVRRHTTRRMASNTSGDAHQWSAPVVRDTFLKFFEERGHTFGGLLGCTHSLVGAIAS